MEKYRIKGLPWGSEIGIKVDNCVTSKEVMQVAGLNFNVDKCELVAEMPFSLWGNNQITPIDEQNGNFSKDGKIYRHLPDAYATYRTDRNIPLGFVKSKYKVTQNIEAFNFFDEAIGVDKCEWRYAGCFGYGHKVFVTAEIKLDTFVDLKEGKKDPVKHYLVFTNSHDGSSSITVMFTPVRFFCLNCLNSGISSADSYIRVRHTVSSAYKLEQGKELLKISFEKAKEATELYQSLYKLNMSDNEVIKYIIDLNLNPMEKNILRVYGDNIDTYKRIIDRDNLTLEGTQISMRKANIIHEMYRYYHEGVEQNRIAGTAWGAYNAVTGYFSNVANLNGEKRMDSLLYGNAQNITQKAISLLCA